jgi:hypothetical protein
VIETLRTTGELLAFLSRRGQWWLIPVLVVGLFVGLGLAVGSLGVFSFVYVIF